MSWMARYILLAMSGKFAGLQTGVQRDFGSVESKYACSFFVDIDMRAAVRCDDVLDDKHEHAGAVLRRKMAE